MWSSCGSQGGHWVAALARFVPFPARSLRACTELPREPQGPHFSDLVREMLPCAGDGGGSHIDRSMPRTSAACQDCRDVRASGGHLDRKFAGLAGGWVCIWGTAWAGDSSGHFHVRAARHLWDILAPTGGRSGLSRTSLVLKPETCPPRHWAQLRPRPLRPDSQGRLQSAHESSPRREVLPRTYGFSDEDSGRGIGFLSGVRVRRAGGSRGKVRCRPRRGVAGGERAAVAQLCSALRWEAGSEI